MKNHNAKKNHTDLEAAPTSKLDGWYAALELIRTGNGELAELQTKLSYLATEQEQLGKERAAALVEESVEGLSRILARGEILTSRWERHQAELADAQERAATTLGHAIGRFSILARIFHGHVFEREKKRLAEQMAPGCPVASLEQVTLYLRPVADVRALEIAQDAGSSVEGFINSGERLLKALEAAPDFNVPEFVPLSPLSKNARAEQGETAPEALIGPLADLPGGLSQREIDLEWTRIRNEDPSLDLAGAGRKLAELHPEIFMTRQEVEELNKPLGQSSAPERWRAPMIGDTTLPNAAEPDQIFATLNAP